MANEISRMTSANISPGSPAKNSSQFAMSENVAPTAETGKALPSDGKALPQQPAERAKISEAVNQINDYIQTVQRNLSFSMDDESGKTVIKVIDSDSGQLIRQIPGDEVLALASHLQDLGSDDAAAEVNPGILFSDST